MALKLTFLKNDLTYRKSFVRHVLQDQPDYDKGDAESTKMSKCCYQIDDRFTL